MYIANVILTSLLSIAALFIITKVMGHKQVSQLDFFDYVCGITIGSIGAELATELESPEKPLIALVIYGIVSLCLNLLTRKLPRTRKYINGMPTVLMNAGTIYRENLKQAKLDISEFMLLCREQGYFNIEDIETAVFEHNGKLSILPKSEARPLTPEDAKINVKKAQIGVELIMDGRVISENLRPLGKDARWLDKLLMSENCDSIKDVLLGIYYPDDNRMMIYPKM